MAATRLGLNVEYDAGALRGPVTLRTEAGVADEELWAFVNRVLSSRGFTTVRTGRRAYSVVRLSDAAGAAEVDHIDDPAQDPAEWGPSPGFRAVMVRARHRPAKELAEALTKTLSRAPGVQGVGGGGIATTVGESAFFLLADLSPRVDQALELLERIDAQGAAVVVEEVPVTNLPAGALATLVAQIAAKHDAAAGVKRPGEVLASPDGSGLLVVAPADRLGEWRALIEELDRREGVRTVTYTPRFFPAREVAKLAEQVVKPSPGADERWRVVVDELTGSLIVTATPAEHQRVLALIERLDQAPAESRRAVRTFVIKNRPVLQVKTILEDLLASGVIVARAQTPQGPAQPSASQQTPPGPPAQQSGPAPTGQAQRDRPAAADAALVLSVDEGTNTLMAVGEPRVLAQVESLLRSLDVRQAQVMLEVLMVSLNEARTLDLGVELEKLRINDDLLVRLSSLFGLGSRSPAGDRTAGDGAGFTGVVLSPGEFSVVVRALRTLNNGRSLSMPRLLVANNQRATLDAVVQQPFASVNASNTVSTTSFGGTLDAGTVVTITPQIAEGDHLLLEYSVSLSAFVGQPSQPELPPPRQQNRVESVATIPDGHTVVVGGIDAESLTRTVSQVPLLGDIPLLGEAFKSRGRSASKSRFFVFIRANILRGRGFEDLKHISAVDTAAAGVDDGWPDVEPRFIR
jgi:general secretion pathway protein D